VADYFIYEYYGEDTLYGMVRINSPHQKRMPQYQSYHLENQRKHETGFLMDSLKIFLLALSSFFS